MVKVSNLILQLRVGGKLSKKEMRRVRVVKSELSIKRILVISLILAKEALRQRLRVRRYQLHKVAKHRKRKEQSGVQRIWPKDVSATEPELLSGRCRRRISGQEFYL